jgi:hypothetical protein
VAVAQKKYITSSVDSTGAFITGESFFISVTRPSSPFFLWGIMVGSFYFSLLRILNGVRE